MDISAPKKSRSGDTVYDLTGLGIEPQTSCTIAVSPATTPTGKWNSVLNAQNLNHMELAEWLGHRAAELVSRVRCPARSSFMMHIYFTNIKT